MGGPLAGHSLSSPVSGAMPSRLGPRNWFQSVASAAPALGFACAVSARQIISVIIVPLPWFALLLHRVTDQRVLVADVHLAARDRRVRPGGHAAQVGLLEAALLLVAGGRRLHERDRPLALV